VVPKSALVAGHTYQVLFGFFAVVKDVAGNNVSGSVNSTFTTGSSVVTTAPQVLLVEPPDGATNVAVNANVRVHFSAPVNGLTVNGNTVAVVVGGQVQVPETIFFGNNNQDVLLVMHEPFPDNTAITVTVGGVQDLAGNAVAPQTTHFTTGTGPDVTAPTVISEAPFSQQTGVPLNAVVNVEFSEPIDFGTVNGSTFAVRDNTGGSVFIGGTYGVSGDNRMITFVPTASLAAGHNYTVFLSQTGGQIADYAGNLLSGTGFTFTSSSTTDLTAPQILQLSPRDGLTQAPINTRVTLFFNKPVAAQSVLNVAQTILATGGIPQQVLVAVFNNNQEVVLTPVNPLAANTTYTISVAGIQDVAGNSMSGPVVTSFTTGSEADLVRPGVVLVDPTNNATGVETNALVRVQFSERIDPVSVTNGTIQVIVNNTGIAIPGTVTASADGLSATFVSGGLLPSTSYRVQVNTNGVTDLAGNGINGLTSNFTTGTGPDTTAPNITLVSPLNGATAVAVNAHISVVFSEAMSSVSMESNPVVVTQAGGAAVAGTLSVSADHTTMTLVPNSPLAPNSSYTVSVSGVADVSGNVAPSFSSSFSTGTATLGTRMTVLSISPSSGASNVATTTPVVVTLSAPVDVSTVNSGSIPVRINNSVLVSGSYVVSNVLNNGVVNGVVTFTPSSPLPPSSSITAVVNTNQVLDVAGNQVNGTSSTFTTGTQ
jgi:hypothetical protein